MVDGHTDERASGTATGRRSAPNAPDASSRSHPRSARRLAFDRTPSTFAGVVPRPSSTAISLAFTGPLPADRCSSSTPRIRWKSGASTVTGSPSRQGGTVEPGIGTAVGVVSCSASASVRTFAVKRLDWMTKDTSAHGRRERAPTDWNFLRDHVNVRRPGKDQVSKGGGFRADRQPGQPPRQSTARAARSGDRASPQGGPPVDSRTIRSLHCPALLALGALNAWTALETKGHGALSTALRL